MTSKNVTRILICLQHDLPTFLVKSVVYRQPFILYIFHK